MDEPLSSKEYARWGLVAEVLARFRVPPSLEDSSKVSQDQLRPWMQGRKSKLGRETEQN